MALIQPRLVKGSTTAVTMWRARKTRVTRATLRWSPVVRKAGHPAALKRSADSTPRMTTALSRTSETAPAARVVYQSSWSVTGYEPPDTATPEPEDELTVPDDDRPDELGELVELALEVEVEVEVVAAAADVEPGMVAALT